MGSVLLSTMYSSELVKGFLREHLFLLEKTIVIKNSMSLSGF